METKIYTCDIEGCKNEAKHLKKSFQVIFTTEQTEGRSVKPYLSGAVIDLCEDHMSSLIKNGKYITANGAQGFNHYYLSKEA